jgi:hypothetical protein
MKDKTELYREAIKLWGVDTQIDMMIEECAELIHSLLKFRRGFQVNVLTELADVEIMSEQMRFIFNPIGIDQEKAEKLKRLEVFITQKKRRKHE